MIFSIKQILVCSDLSEKSDEVLREAEILRERLGAKADVLFVSDLNEDPDKQDDCKIKLQNQIARTHLEASQLLESGDVVEKINDLIINGRKKYDLLVIGHTSQVGLVSHLLGSVAKEILSNAPLPTIVVKKKFNFHKIASLVDGSPPMDWMVVTSLDFYRNLKFDKIEFISLWHDLPDKSLFEQHDADLEDVLKEEVDYMMRENERFELVVRPTSDLLVADHLARILIENKIDLAIVKRNRGKKINAKILGSQTLRLLNFDINLLIMPI
jgi:nucleotide-binding universal stress UspA family protein